VQNATATQGLARLLGVVLQHDGFPIVGVTQAASTAHPTTEVIVHDPAVAYSGRALASMLHVSLSQAPAASQPAGSTTPQITVIVGDDFPGAGQ
jgi:hypothetical protein